ncbi:LPS biosynthesis glycosyltransferase [Leptolyngbyaceae cyanobacterium CCMR0082]|uniref:LPS biosynthesis glycosyltransferase n=1 Tax=Adonisia turfae CCMR0082 TaxID=2304604 RepID=A0A6M0S9W0_9CYAN|nr:LPS biosynthesis glycosyltransferase [Adonisia turfae]NEZ65288.1 LPS biosynthesis glycosyltransferase [Adonisia turfae CCMR0082]
MGTRSTDSRSTDSRLIDTIGQILILAYQEDTEQLSSFLGTTGCHVEVLRQMHRSEYKNYSRSYLCLLNHRKAWEQALLSEKPTLIVEADFVPVANFAQLPSPFDPNDKHLGIAWLYTCASQIYTITDQGYAQGYSTAMVAYVITKQSAWRLIELAEMVKADPGPEMYTPWDSGIEYYLRDRNFHNYVPWRNYGEHGGIPNPEHQQNNLSTTHRADVLYGPLAFEPAYGKVLKERTYGRVKGLGRLLLNKYLRGPVLSGSTHPGRLLRFALSRQFTLRL